jgi:DNA-binding NarL/FixJ family response regulator
LVLNSKQEQAIINDSFVRILVVDDFALWRRFLIEKLGENRSFRIVGVVADGLEAVLKAEELQPDLILLDIGLPGISGIEAARQIRRVAPKSKILFLSQELDLQVVQAALTEGGQGFVVKSDADDELFPAIDAVMLGKTFESRRLSRSGANMLDLQLGELLKSEDDVAPPLNFSPPKREPRCHEVHCYSNDSLFLDGFTHFIGTALKAGRSAVFIGTVSHRTAILERLHAESQENRTAIREGRYVALDAAEFLSNFMVNDMPDAGWFLRVVSPLVATPSGVEGAKSRVAACGECAPLLWAEGKADAAIRLEELWNEIATRYDVDLLCGYQVEKLRCDEDSYTFRRICEEHSAVHS